ncbi:hypothetical protein ACIQNU_03360 [Streptomyces sp. NPDC091292]|uniref:hypothetical protein n=1 Tax=Streptomyces sp. NPDC091292 TaxID=3365991 RepID=UPI0038227E01
MPRIRILQSVAGLDFSWVPGDIVEVNDAAAEAWADGDRAELAPDDAPVTVPATPGQEDTEQGSSEGPFDPAAARADDVLTYLATADEAEALRVLDAEAAGKGRVTITKQRDDILAAARERAAQDPADDPPQAENAAEAARGGGRGPVPETRTDW